MTTLTSRAKIIWSLLNFFISATFKFSNLHSKMHNYEDTLSSSKAECSTRTASSVYFSSMIQEIRISEVLIIMMLMFSLARALNILDATPE